MIFLGAGQGWSQETPTCQVACLESRKGSTSSVGSGSMSGSMSGIDDIPISGTTSYDEDAASIPVNVYDGPGPGPGVGTRFDVHKGDYVDGDSQGSKGWCETPENQTKGWREDILWSEKDLQKQHSLTTSKRKATEVVYWIMANPVVWTGLAPHATSNNDLRDSSNQ